MPVTVETGVVLRHKFGKREEEGRIVVDDIKNEVCHVSPADPNNLRDRRLAALTNNAPPGEMATFFEKA